ncbi:MULTISPECIES: hypothetical protein [Catenuloplanes]|uniref:Uncharacterized protein n=1 Tax=Catenuloplanes niger TaxID=587534 RepID=A0AAE4CPL7_9ACTN|nr:hypothetical protein [Catenuloplanes niger]MDR7320080.1 hypothetical protein [Catenuloplanes niger]
MAEPQPLRTGGRDRDPWRATGPVPPGDVDPVSLSEALTALRDLAD